MDEKYLEFAEKLEQAARDYGAAKASALTRPEKDPNFDGQHCVECEDPIPAARLAMGRVRCVPCQTFKEKYAR